MTHLLTLSVMTTYRPPRARPLALAALALAAGLASGLSGFAEALLAAGAVAAAAAGLAAVALDERGMLVAVTLLCVAIGGAVTGLGERRRTASDCRRGWESGEEVRIEAVAAGYLPRGERGSVRLRPATAGVDCGWRGDIRAWAKGPVRPGVRYSLTGAWQPARTPGRGLRAPERWGWVTADVLQPVEAASFSRHPFLALRGWLADRLWRVYPRRWAPLAQALVLGQRETLSRETTQRIARAGLAHLLAISGLHVGMIAAALFGLARAAGTSVGAARWTMVALTCVYVLVIGAPASAVRAAVMVCLWTLTRVAGRASSPFDVLGLAGLLLLLARPWSVAEPGFQLSFAGAAAVGYAHTESRRIRWPESVPGWIRASAAGMLGSAAAVLLTAPITAVFFGRVAPAAIVGNLVAIPLLSLALPALFASAVLAPWPALAQLPAGAAVLVLSGIDLVASLLSRAPWGSLEMKPPDLVTALGYLTLLVLSAHATHGAWQRRRFILAMGVAWSVVIAGPALKGWLVSPGIAVYVLDVGQGDGIAVRTPNRHWLLVDAGPNVNGYDAGAIRVLPFFREQGVRSLEAWVASHPDLDHVGGFPSIARAIDVERVIGVGYITGQIGQVELLRQILQDSLLWLRAQAGARLAVDSVELEFLYPPRDLRHTTLTQANELSLVFSLRYGKFRMLFTGDVPGAVEDRLSHEDPAAVHAQVLKVSHHGSASSTSRNFLAAVNPELAVISVGRGNRYGHPSVHTLRRLALSGVPTRRTDRDGTVAIEARADGSWTARSAAEGF